MQYTDVVALLAEMTSVFLAVDIMHEESASLGLESGDSLEQDQNSMTWRQSSDNFNGWGRHRECTVEVLELFIYLDRLISSNGGNEQEIQHWIVLTRNCMAVLDRHIWQSLIAIQIRSVFTQHTSFQCWCMGASLGHLQKAFAQDSTFSTCGPLERFWAFQTICT